VSAFKKLQHHVIFILHPNHRTGETLSLPTRILEETTRQEQIMYLIEVLLLCGSIDQAAEVECCLLSILEDLVANFLGLICHLVCFLLKSKFPVEVEVNAGFFRSLS